MLHVRHRRFRAAFTAAAMLVCAPTAPSALAMSVAPESCSEFVRTYLEGPPDGSTVNLGLDVYSVGPPVAEIRDIPTLLTLRYSRYPAVAGRLSSTASDSAGVLITADHGHVQAFVQTESTELAVEVLGCRGPSQLYGTIGNQIIGLAFKQN
jgi:hypothetical protein